MAPWDACSRSALMMLVIGLLAATASVSAAAEQNNGRKLFESWDEQIKVSAKKATAFCKSPEIKKLYCGWATQEEQGKTSVTCNLCGIIWAGEVTELPHKFEYFSGSSHRYPRFVSLACRPGELVSRAVYKILRLPTGADATRMDWAFTAPILYTRQMGTLVGNNYTNVRRCDLQLPAHDKTAPKGETSKSEVDAALRSKEVNCKLPPKDDYMKFKTGQWYSDTVVFQYSGCNGVAKPNATYTPTMPYIIHNPGLGFLLAKFEVQEYFQF